MSHAGNIKGRRGTYIGPAPTRPEGGPPGQMRKAGLGNGVAGEEKTQIGRMPTEAGSARSGSVSEEKTQIGRTPTETDSERSGGVREERPTGIWNFSDGLEQGSEPRAGKARDGQSGRFDGPRVRSRTQEGAAEVFRFENRSSRRTGERPQLPTPRATMEAPLLEEGPATWVPVSTPDGPKVSGGKPKPLEELLPTFSESIGEESLAQHFAEELRYLGADLRPSRMAPSERAERLWSFFRAYAEANARDPAGQTEAGRERFREALTRNGFTGLRDANTGRDGVEVALQMLEARSPEELHEKLAEVRIEPGPEMLPSEVSTPVVEEHRTLPELPAPERPVQKQPGVAGPAELEQAEQPQLAPLQAGAHSPPPGVVVPGMVPPGVRAWRGDEVDPEADDVPTSGHAHRGTNKRLGSHMLWNFLHRFRDSPEMSAVEREKWSQVAFGAILALVGAALVLAMLASL